MSKNTNESADYVDIEDLYVSVGKSLAIANRLLEKDTEEIYYAVVESEISIPYQGITQQDGRIRVKLPETAGTTETLPKINFKIRPVPRVQPEETIEEDLPVRVPQLVKLPLDEALASLISAGLRPGKIVYDSRAKPKGTVISQELDSGSEVKLGTKMDMYVAGESLKIEIPAESVKPTVTRKSKPKSSIKRKKAKKG